MHGRKYKVASGPAYPIVYTGSNKPTIAKANPNDREKYYRDPAVRLSKHDLDNFVGKPVFIEHNTKGDPVGVVSQTRLMDDGGMYTALHIFDDATDQYGNNVYQQVKTGKLKGMSVGYIPTKTGTRNYNRCEEISLVREPFFKGAEIRVAASNEINQELIFKIEMSENTVSTTQSVVDPVPVPENKEAVEVMKMGDETLQAVLRENVELKRIEAERAPLLKKLKTEKDEREKAALELRLENGKKYGEMSADIYVKNNPDKEFNRARYTEVAAMAWGEKTDDLDLFRAVAASNMEHHQKVLVEYNVLKTNADNNMKAIKASRTPVQNTQSAPATTQDFNSVFKLKATEEEIKVYGLDRRNLPPICASKIPLEIPNNGARIRPLGEGGMRITQPQLFNFMRKEFNKRPRE